jgi:hypothetical protein
LHLNVGAETFVCPLCSWNEGIVSRYFLPSCSSQIVLSNYSSTNSLTEAFLDRIL